MSYKIIPTREFARKLKALAKKYPSVKGDIAALVTSLSVQPNQGSPLGNSVYKIRLAVTSKGSGKRGGARVITYLYAMADELETDGELYLLTIYDKSSQSSVSDTYLAGIIEQLNL